MKIPPTFFFLFLLLALGATAVARESVTDSSSVPLPSTAEKGAPASPFRSGTLQTNGSATPQNGSHAQEKGAPAPSEKADALAAARIISIVGENVTKAKRGWVSLEPGARPAYVGIQGGTAPITLLRSSRGSLLGYTGKTGNDFIQLLQGKGADAEDIPPSDSKEALELPLPPPTIADFAAHWNSPLFTSPPPMQPFGLSTPEHVVQQEEAKAEQPVKQKAAPAKKKGKKAAAKKAKRPKKGKPQPAAAPAVSK